jgi:type II secretory pathway component GspD/PulD (secretin)
MKSAPRLTAILLLVLAACGRSYDATGGTDSSLVAEPLVGPPPFEIMAGDIETVIEVKRLAQSCRFEAAMDLLREYRFRHPEDLAAGDLELALEIAKKERDMLGMVTEQASEKDLLLTDYDYQAAKEVAQRPVRERLSKAEWLASERRFPEAISVCNAILRDYPFDRATLTFKNHLLDYVSDFNRKKIARDKAIRDGEVINELEENTIMPREPKPLPRTVIVFDEDLEAAAREEVLAKLRILIPSINYQAAPIGAVLKEIFAIAGINYVIEDEAISAKTLDIRLINVSLEKLLEIIRRVEQLSFNYRGNTVYVTNRASEVLVTEMIRLQAGLTDTQREVKLGQVNNGSSTGGGGGGNNTTDIFADDSGNSDLERLIAELPSLVPDWPAGSVTYYEPKSHTIYIKSSSSAIAEAKRLIHAMDYTSAMVLIEAKFIEISDEAERELGVQWKIGAFKTSGSQGVIAGGAQNAGTASGTLFSDLAQFANPDLAYNAARGAEAAIATANTAHGGGFTLGILGAGLGMNPNFEAQLNALESRGMANTLSEPKILTISNATGMIDISRDFVYIESVQVEDLDLNINNNNNGGSVTPTLPNNRVVQPEIATDYEGINFVVQPSVARNGDIITMHVVPTVRFTSGTPKKFDVTTADGQDIGDITRYEFQTRRLATTLHIKNGQTIVMGGLITAADTKNRSGIPFLMDIPLLGMAFRTDRTQVRRNKLLIFLTAYLIDPRGPKYSDEVAYLRDIAKVVLPPSVQREIDERDAAAAIKAEQDRREYRLKAEAAFQPPPAPVPPAPPPGAAPAPAPTLAPPPARGD